MKIGILSDAHGNSLGLKLCLAAMEEQEVSEIHYLGDCVGYLPDVRGVYSLLKASRTLCLRGNHEEMLLGNIPFPLEQEKVYQLERAKNILSDRALLDFSKWPFFRKKEIDGRKLMWVHGNPWDFTTGYVYPNSDLERFKELPVDAVFLGHTHHPFIRKAGGVLVVNVGSCGLPRDQGNLASYAIYDTASSNCQIYRIPFDTDRLIRLHEPQLHPYVIECLRRRPSTTVVGRIL